MKSLILVIVSAIALTITTKSQTWFYYDNTNSIIPDLTIRDLECNHVTGNVYVFFSNSSIYQLTGTNFLQQANSCTGVRFFFDNSGARWFATVYNTAVLKDSACTIYNSNGFTYDYPDPVATCVDNYNNKWVSTLYGTGGTPQFIAFVYRFDGISWQTWQMSDDIKVSCINADNNNNIWVGTRPYGNIATLFKYNGTIWSYYNNTNSTFPISSIYSIAVDENNNKWIGTGGGLVKFDDTTFTLTATLGFPVCQVNDIEIDRFGVLWCATSQGLVRYDGVSAYTYNTSNTTLPSNNMKFAAIDGNDNIWIAFNSINGVAKGEGLITGSEKLKVESEKLKVYPNPSGNKIKISVPNHTKETGVSIYNLSGSEVFKEQFKSSEIEINTESFQKGVYLLKVNSGGEVFNERVVIN